MDNQPLPCPFCGELPQLRDDPGDCRIFCVNPTCKVFSHTKAQTLGEVLAQWNTRTSDARLAAMRERAERAEKGIRNALVHANGRWCEWGMRAEAVLEVLESALSPAALSPTPSASEGGGK